MAIELQHRKGARRIFLEQPRQFSRAVQERPIGDTCNYLLKYRTGVAPLWNQYKKKDLPCSPRDPPFYKRRGPYLDGFRRGSGCCSREWARRYSP